jgi:hypothetical protein
MEDVGLSRRPYQATIGIEWMGFAIEQAGQPRVTRACFWLRRPFLPVQVATQRARRRSGFSRQPSATSLQNQWSWTTSDVVAIVAIVSGVAAEHGLERTATRSPSVLVTYARPPAQGGRTLRVSVLKPQRQPPMVEVNVLEWPAFRHSASGFPILDELRGRLREKFGANLVSATEPSRFGS